jgi:hypothetical protein
MASQSRAFPESSGRSMKSLCGVEEEEKKGNGLNYFYINNWLF